MTAAERIGTRRVVASVSGGKDSAAMSLHLRELGIEHDRVFMDTGWEADVTYDYLRGELTRVLGPIAEIRADKLMEHRSVEKGMFPSRIRRYEVPRDDRMIDLLVTVGRAFWKEHVEPNRMPLPDGSERARRVLLRAYPRLRSGLRPMPEDVAAMARQYADASVALGRLASLRDTTANRLCAVIGDGEGFDDGADTRVTWRPQRGRVDWEAVARAKGATDADGEAHRLPDTRTLRVRRTGEDDGAGGWTGGEG